MRALKKLGAIVYLLAGIVALGVLAGSVYGSTTLRNHIAGLVGHPAGSIALLICLIILALGVFISAIVALAERRPPASIHPAGNPNIEIRLAALSSVARAAIASEDVLVERIESRVIGRDASRACITIELIAFTDIGLGSLGKRIQLRVEEACERMLGVPGVTAQIKFLPSVTTVMAKEVSREQA